MNRSEADGTEWSLPGAADAPKDTLKVQLEVYGETILLRGFEREANWVRTVSADEIANVFTQQIGFSSGLLAENTLWWGQGETGETVGLWRPPRGWAAGVQGGGRGRRSAGGGLRGSGRSRFRERRSSRPRGSGSPCRGWSSSARRAERPGSTPR